MRTETHQPEDDMESLFEMALEQVKPFESQSKPLDVKALLDRFHSVHGRTYASDDLVIRLIGRLIALAQQHEERRTAELHLRLGAAGDLFAAMTSEANRAVNQLESFTQTTMSQLNDVANRLRMAGTHRATEIERGKS